MIRTENGEEIKTQQVDSDSIKCKRCGANMNFDPETQKLKCSYCEYTEDFDKSDNVAEISIEKALEKNEKWSSEALVFQCDNCGAKIVAEKGQTAILCPFCGTSHVTSIEDLEGIKPNAVVPFRFTAERIKECFKKWGKKRLLAPNEFKKTAFADNVKGVYMPFFTFDSNTNSVYEGRVGYEHTRTVRRGKETVTETYVEWRRISGTYTHFFDDVLISAGNRFDNGKLDKICPFDLPSAKVFENKFLTGYIAHRYEKDIQTCWGGAKKKIDEKLRELIISQYHCDRVDYLNVSTHHSNVTYKYILLPVYIINYNYKGKQYTLYANGSTGKIAGKSPVSPIKATIAGVLGAIAAAGIILLILYLNGII